jgi:hypothetical protein
LQGLELHWVFRSATDGGKVYLHPYQGADVLFIVPTIGLRATRIAISSWSEEATIFVKFVASASIAGIEHLLRLHHAVEDVLIVVEETPDEPRLHACYVTQDDALSVADLKNHLAMHAPAWMIPEKFSRVPVLPMTANGKKDRLRLKNSLLEQV